MHNKIYHLTLTAMLTAIATVGGSLFEFSIEIAKVAPMQHLINLICGVLLGPWWALIQAFLTSLLRNILGTGTILAFPGSMIGAFICGFVFKYTHKLLAAAFGELIGTGIIGAFVAYPVAAYFLSKKGAIWLFVPGFFFSALAGVIIGYIILKAIWKTVVVPRIKD